jgi:toxin ParE1/3/4
MKYELRILPAADRDVDVVAAFIAQDNLNAALRFYDAIDQTYRLIRDKPARWPRYTLEHPRLQQIRKRSVMAPFGNYLVFYHVIGSAVEVIRVLHGARDIPAVLGEKLSVD